MKNRNCRIMLKWWLYRFESVVDALENLPQTPMVFMTLIWRTELWSYLKNEWKK